MFTSGVSKTGKRFIPLLFAGDINVYSVARAFNEEYGCIAKAYGKADSVFCGNSIILDYSKEEKCDERSVFFDLVEEFAQNNQDAIVMLVPCGDKYVELSSLLKDQFRTNVVCPTVRYDLIKKLTNKDSFYLECAEANIPFPKTVVCHKGEEQSLFLTFGPPYILKPANGNEYWAHPFNGQKKVFKIKSKEELFATLEKVNGSGYSSSMIIQEFIPGGDDLMRVLTSYSDSGGHVQMMCLGHVLLEEHTPHGIGNHAVIMTEYNRELMERHKAFLEKIAYTGWSNFDIKYDQRDGEFKTLEINARQGRSNYYVTASGANIARYMVEDLIDKTAGDCEMISAENLWMNIPYSVAKTYVKDAQKLKGMQRLRKSGYYVNPLSNKAEKSFIRKLRIAKNQLGHFYKFYKYMK